ncbi:hypothetical protein PAXRUDRAFT_829259 [Paxillus rubicundulus Ve08.2h10]|uniref:Uncharacterized protein n=1 Tax=Paxillus rubicundulus Ve08.2h10 TaxID=930991 RepID=A0A0D0DN16_9AGAM|nr:hypothetical protein PAXRUDRAFT_829259 [Paxillus rubicundulus Ve08.2h10]
MTEKQRYTGQAQHVDVISSHGLDVHNPPKASGIRIPWNGAMPASEEDIPCSGAGRVGIGTGVNGNCGQNRERRGRWQTFLSERVGLLKSKSLCHLWRESCLPMTRERRPRLRSEWNKSEGSETRKTM